MRSWAPTVVMLLVMTASIFFFSVLGNSQKLPAGQEYQRLSQGERQAAPSDDETSPMPSPFDFFTANGLKALARYCSQHRQSQPDEWLHDKFICDVRSTDVLIAGFTGLLFVATLLLVASTVGLWIATFKSTNIAERALIAGERAFVFALNLNGFWEFHNDTRRYSWRFRPVWQNSGDTPTKNMTMHTRCILRDTPLPVDFDFGQTVGQIGTALIPPKTTTMGGMSPIPGEPAISPQDITDIQEGRKHLYLLGWARYRDVFPTTPEHITRFCFIITPIGDPVMYSPTAKIGEPGSLIFPSIHFTRGNCFDDECEAAGLSMP
jgi:hypothetical protein